jgi:hypothetical protein
MARGRCEEIVADPIQKQQSTNLHPTDAHFQRQRAQIRLFYSVFCHSTLIIDHSLQSIVHNLFLPLFGPLNDAIYLLERQRLLFYFYSLSELLLRSRTMLPHTLL